MCAAAPGLWSQKFVERDLAKRVGYRPPRDEETDDSRLRGTLEDHVLHGAEVGSRREQIVDDTYSRRQPLKMLFSEAIVLPELGRLLPVSALELLGRYDLLDKTADIGRGRFADRTAHAVDA